MGSLLPLDKENLWIDRCFLFVLDYCGHLEFWYNPTCRKSSNYDLDNSEKKPKVIWLVKERETLVTVKRRPTCKFIARVIDFIVQGTSNDGGVHDFLNFDLIGTKPFPVCARQLSHWNHRRTRIGPQFMMVGCWANCESDISGLSPQFDKWHCREHP